MVNSFDCFVVLHIIYFSTLVTTQNAIEMRTLWALALLAAVAESLTIQDAAITSGNGEDEDNPADEGI